MQLVYLSMHWASNAKSQSSVLFTCGPFHFKTGVSARYGNKVWSGGGYGGQFHRGLKAVKFQALATFVNFDVSGSLETGLQARKKIFQVRAVEYPQTP